MQSRPPVGVAAFVGREHERAKVSDLVTDTRVVTLTGSGGCGKTRLAMEVAGDVAPRFVDGAYWVDLQRVNEPELVAPALGGAVNIYERPEQALIDTLAEQLHAWHLLIVLDNCEHLVEACAELVGKLSSTCPQLHVLATSRVPLVVEGEATFQVSPLPVPGPDAGSASTVGAADAARLFEVRARQVIADFRINDDNALTVAAICRHLDGIPLAVELAAARVRVLAPEQIAAGLSDRFRLLNRGARGKPPRQRTLEASLNWSYDLLDDAQRLALARLSVFAGPFELDAAEAVVSGDGIDGEDVLDLVTGLIEQSLVQVAHHQGSSRYRLLETIREYGRQRLHELDNAARVRGRHLQFHVELADRAHAGLTGGHPEPWMARLVADLDDLRAAMDWAAETRDLRALVNITEPIVRFWFDRGQTGDVCRRLQDTIRLPEAGEDERVRGLTTAALLALTGGELAAGAHRSACQAVDAARAADMDGALALGLSVRAQTGAITGLSTNEQLEADVAEAITHAGHSGDAATRAYVLAMAGWTLLHSSTIAAACRTLEQAIEVCETADFPFHLPAAHAVLGLWPVFSGRLDRTRHHALRACEVARHVGRPGWEAVGLAGLGAAEVLEGDHARARGFLSKAQSVLQGPGLEGVPYGDEFIRPWLPLAAFVSGDLKAACDAAADVVWIGRRRGRRWDESIGEWVLGLVAHGQSNNDDARAHLEASRALSTDPRLPFPLGRSLLGLAELAKEEEDLHRAWELAHHGLEILDDYGDRVGTAAALETIAGLDVAIGASGRALRLLAASQRFHTDMGIARFPFQAERFDRARNSAQAALDSTEATAYWETGGDLSLADAVAYASRGRGERHRPQIGWASLTPGERDVARLVAQGRTNAEIGQRLFISVNTVKKHLSHVYAKVDVEGRADLAAQVVRRGL